MSAAPTNPFVLPGLGQTGEHAANPLLASMEMMRQAFAGLAGSGGFNAAMPMTPTMNPEDLEKRIAELKTVENWLKLNLSMLSSTIQGMEVQLATIATLRSFAASMSQTQQTTGADAPSALEVMLGLRPQVRTSTPENQQASSPMRSEPETAEKEPSEKEAAKAQQESVGPDASIQAPAAAKAWWDMLHKQFNQVAAATAATLKHSADPTTVKQSATKPAPKKTPVKKTAIKKASTPRASKKSTPSHTRK